MDPILLGTRIPESVGGGTNMPQYLIGMLGMTSALMNIVEAYWTVNEQVNTTISTNVGISIGTVSKKDT